MPDIDPDPRSPLLTVGAWTLDVEGRRVTGVTGSTRLEPKAMALLLVLASRAGQVVPRRDLLQAAWGDELATDDVLSRSISEIRRALGDDPRNPSIIETIRGRGYRLLLEQATAETEPSHRVEPAMARADMSGVRAPAHSRTSIRASAPGALVALVALVLIIGVGATLVTRRPETGSEHWILEPYSSLPGPEGNVRLAPDGLRIAYTMRDPESPDDALVVESITGSNRVRIAEGAIRYIAWSPDGAEIIFTRPDGTGWEIVAVPSLGGVERRLAHLERPVLGGIDWSASGQAIAVSSPERPFAPFEIELLDTEALRLEALRTDRRTTVGDVYPAFLPDGRLAFARYVSETGADLFVADPKGGEVRLTSDGEAISAIAVTPGGRAITYATDRDGRSTIWTIPVTGGRRRRLLDTERSITDLSHARRGDVLVAALAERRQNLWRVELEHDARPVRFLPSTRVDGLPSFSPGDDLVAFISTRSGSADLWIAARDGGEVTRITEIGNLAGVPSWAPDGRRIAVQRRTDERTSVWIVDIARRSAAPLKHDVGDLLAPSWTRDGASILASSNATGAWEIWRLPVDGGTAQRLTRNGGLRALESPDGQRVYFTKAEEPGLWVYTVASGTEQVVLPSFAAGNWTNWVLSGESLISAEAEGAGHQRIVRRSLSSGEATVLVRGARIPMGTGGVAISADGRTLIYAIAERREADLYRIVRGDVRQGRRFPP